MIIDKKDIIQNLLKDPEKLLQKKPFHRGLREEVVSNCMNETVALNTTKRAKLPNIKKKVISQSEYMKELDPFCHRVLFDENIPSITMKLAPEQGGGYVTIEHKRLSVSFQRNIKDKQVLHLCGNPMEFTLMDTEPIDEQQQDYIMFKQYWNLRNQDGVKTKVVDAQKSLGDSGWLFYYDRDGQVKSKLLSYADGYVLCPHNDDNGDRILESVYYVSDDVEYIDSYDDTYLYRYENSFSGDDGQSWKLTLIEEHGFPEIPLITKRGPVAWDNAQTLIESYEILYNIFVVLQKRHGWGILYIKGNFDSSSGRKIAGAVILNDKSMQDGADAKFLTPPSPQGTIDTLQLMEESIQKATSTTFLLPKDVKTSGDISGIAIMLTQSMDIENALQGVIEWQNVADKACRLFKAGLARELVHKGIVPDAITRFENLHINAKFRVWRPQSDTDLVNRLSIATSGGFLSVESATELNPDAKPDEKSRLKKETEKQMQEQLNMQKAQAEIAKQNNEGREENSNNQ